MAQRNSKYRIIGTFLAEYVCAYVRIHMHVRAINLNIYTHTHTHFVHATNKHPVQVYLFLF